MGSTNSKIEQIQKFDLDQWETLQTNSNYDLVRHRINKNLAEMTNVIVDPKRSDDDQLAIYQFRNSSKAPIVKTLGVKKQEPKSTGICGSQRTMKVLTQRIIKRWKQFPQLTFPESVYCLREALEGYRVLEKKAGPFQVTDKMMGINNEGEFKVWANQNFGLNHPEHQRPILNTSENQNLESVSSQNQMLNNVISVIEDKNEQGRFPQDLRKNLHKTKTFQKCQQELDDYIFDKKLIIPKKIHPNLGYVIQKRIVSTNNNYSNNNYSNNNYLNFNSVQQQQIPITHITETQYVPTHQPISNQHISSSSNNQFLSQNTQRIQTENPVNISSNQNNRYQYTTSYIVNEPRISFSNQQYGTPKQIDVVENRPNIMTAESVYQKNITEFNSQEKKGQNYYTQKVNNNYLPGNIQYISESNIIPVERNTAVFTKQVRTTQPPQNQRITYNAPTANIKFNYGTNEGTQHNLTSNYVSHTYSSPTYINTNIGNPVTVKTDNEAEILQNKIEQISK